MTVWPLLGLSTCLLLTACSPADRPGSAPAGSPPGSPPALAPTLDAGTAAEFALAADDARRLAYAGVDPAPLGALYTPALLATETRHLAGLAQRGEALEEAPQERRVVHLGAGPGRAEVVLAVRGLQRLRAPASSVPGVSARPWSAFVRQWALQLVWAGGRWLVDAAQDLPPDRWWN